MRILRFFLCIGLWSTTPVSAQDLCVAVIDLQRVFTTLESAARHDQPLSASQRSELLRIDGRYTAFSVRLAFRDSPVSDLTPIIINAYTLSNSILDSLVHDGTSPLLYGPSTVQGLDRGLAILGRLDCPPPSGVPMQDGTASGLLKSLDPVDASEGFQISLDARNIVITTLGVGLTTLILLGIGAAYRRKHDLAKRYNCNLPVVLILSGDTPSIAKGVIKDISRSGSKIHADDSTDIPPIGRKVTLQIGEDSQHGKVQWRNAHYFGVQLTQPLRSRDLQRLIGGATPQKAVKRGSKADRAR